MLLVRIFLLPISALYGLITEIRNRLFDWGILSSKGFAKKIISVGNLSVGGTGKTPHIEYLIRLLGGNPDIATLSRGYKRKTKGFKLATSSSTVDQVGDEPMQYRTKFSMVHVAVDEKRVNGVEKLLKEFPDIQTILLDDAFQHRWIKPSLNILLIDYSNAGESQFMLPSGNLRESRRNTKRADVIIISKCPEIFSPIEKRRLMDDISVDTEQQLFFSYMKYLKVKPITPAAKKMYQNHFDLSDHNVIGLTGIAKDTGFKDYVSRYSKESKFISLDDHHDYKLADIIEIEQDLEDNKTKNYIIVTTEKDAVKLTQAPFYTVTQNLPLFALPIEVKFHDDEETFNNLILEHVKSN